MAKYKVTVLKGDRVKVLEARTKDLTALLNRVGSYLVRLSRASFLNQQFGSNKWASRKVPNVMGIVEDLSSGPSIEPDRLTPRPALVHTGSLRSSIAFRVIGRDSVAVGSALPYARLHQLGGKSTIPVPQAAKRNLATLLKSQPELRKDLGFLFRRDSVSANVPARPFVGITPAAKSKINTLVKDFFAQRGDFRKTGAEA